MPHSRSKILPDRDRIYPDCPQILQDTDHLVLSFAQPQHNPRLRINTGIDLLHLLENSQRPIISRLWADDSMKARHRLHIVVVNLWMSIANRLDTIVFAFEIGREN